MPNLNTLLDRCVLLVYEFFDRFFLNGYVARLQDADDLRWFLTRVRGHQIPRYEILGEMSRRFVAAVEKLAADLGIPLIEFERGKRKEEIVAPLFEQARLADREGVVLIGWAQERLNVFSPPNKQERQSGKFAPKRHPARPKSFYFYIWDRDWGPTNIRICTYAPFAMRINLNGQMWLIQHLRRSGHYLEAIDNGIADVDDKEALRRLCRRFRAAHVQRYFDRWMYRLPSPFTAQDRKAGFRHELSMLQVEVSRTEVFDRPLHARQFFAAVIRDHLDLGRPDQLQIVFGRRVSPKHRRGRPPFRTRVFNQGVHVSLNVEHRKTSLKQYLKWGKALRTETTFNETRDFGVGKKVADLNLSRLFELGREFNRRLLAMERQSHRAAPSATQIRALVMPSGPAIHRVPGLRLGDPRVAALFAALCRFQLIFGGFRRYQLQALVTEHLGAEYSGGQAAYDLARLKGKGLIFRVTESHRYKLTELGMRMATIFTEVHSQILCAGLTELHPDHPPTPLNTAYRAFQKAVRQNLVGSRMAA